MKNNIKAILATGLGLMTFVSQAQDYRTTVMAYSMQKAPVILSATTTVSSSPEIVDYPTVSYPETAGFTAEKEKAVYHLSWQVMMRENLSYTEVQSSTDGVNFTTVGFAKSARRTNTCMNREVHLEDSANPTSAGL